MGDTRPSTPAVGIDISNGAEDIVATIREGGLDPDAVTRTVANLVRHPESLEIALGAADRAGMTTLEASADLTVLRIVWPAGVRLAAHDHQMWAVVGVYRGTEHNLLFRRSEDGLHDAGDHRIEPGGTLTMGREAVHAVANPRSEPCVALHVYGGDLRAARRTTWSSDGEEHPYDTDALARILTSLREREDELGRPLGPGETRVLLAHLC